MDPNDQNQPDTAGSPASPPSDVPAGDSTPSDGSGMPPNQPTDSGVGHQEEELPPPPPAAVPSQEGSQGDTNPTPA